VNTLGPLPPPLEASKSGCCPVRCVVTPGGAFAASTARTFLTLLLPLNVFSPPG
jgi:hypothetical protein